MRAPSAGEAGFLAVFDVDGTLLDGGPMIAETMREAFAVAGAAPPRAEDVTDLIGLSLHEIVASLARGLTAEARDKILVGYRTRFYDAFELSDELPIFAGADAALRTLSRRGVRLAIASGRRARGVRYMLDAMGWADLVAVVQTADDNPSKPDPTMLRRALREAGVGPDRAVMIGDSRYDMRMARAAGVPALGVEWGYNPAEELRAEGARDVAGGFAALTAMVLEMAGTP
jgi:phosphoglycolate phosphatase